MIHLQDTELDVPVGLCGLGEGRVEEGDTFTLTPVEVTCEECKKCYDLIMILSSKMMDKEIE